MSTESLRRKASEGQRQSNSYGRGSARQSKKSPPNGKKRHALFNIGMGIDLPFLIILLALVVIGLIMMFSASYAYAYYRNDDSLYYLKRQLIFALVGIVIMFCISYVDYRYLRPASYIFLGLSYLALILVLVLPGQNGVHRWIGVAGFGVQASEFSKFAIILFLAHWCTLYKDKMDTIKYGVLPAAAIFASTAFLLLLEPHYSGIVIMLLLTVMMLYLGGIKLKWLGIAVGFAIVAALVCWATGLLSYAMTRMDGWGQALVYTTEEMWQTTWQTRNGMYAIGSGGLFGLGLGNSRQKYLYLPEPQNDFIFAVVCEELGLVGAFVILLLFGLLIWRGIRVSLEARDHFGKLLGIGLTSQIGIQVILNILVITDWLPNTGISLPFFSYGGSSLIMLLAQMGVLLSISRHSNIEKI